MSDLFSHYGNEPFWVAFELDVKPNGKVGKLPINPNTGQTASANKPSTWGTLEQARQRCAKLVKQGKQADVGFHTTGAPELCFLDLDECFEGDEKLRPWADRIAKQTGSAYAYRTPSGKGLRIVVDEGEGSIHRTVRQTPGQVELFQNTNRFVVVSEEVYDDRYELNLDGQGTRDKLLARLQTSERQAGKSNPETFNWGDDTGAEFDPTHCVEGQRSEVFASDIFTMLHKGMTPTDCVRNLTGAVCAEKYEDGDRLEQEVHRVCEKFLEKHAVLPCFKDSEQTDDRHDNRIDLKARPDKKRELLGFGELMTPISQQWLVEGVIPMGTTGVLFGEPGSKKTFVCLHTGLSLATGKAPFGCSEDFELPPKHHFVMIAGEGQTTLRTRIGAWRQANGICYPNVSFQTSAEDFTNQSSIDELADDINSRLDLIDPTSPVFLVVDTLSQNMVGDENGEGITLFVRNLERLRQRLSRAEKEATAMAIHHTKKDGSDYRGGSALHGNCDFMLRLQNTNDPLRVTLNRYKSKVAEAGVDIGDIRFEEVVFMKEDMFDEPTDEPEDGINTTLNVLPNFTTPPTPQREIDRKVFMEETYEDGIKCARWAKQIHQKFGITQVQARRLIDEFVFSRPHLRKEQPKGNAYYIFGKLDAKGA